MISIIDYNMGNLFSIKGALEFLKADYEVIYDPTLIIKAEKIILPGVGSFSEAMDIIVERGIDEALKEAVLIRKTPILGICLGMQLLAKGGNEGGYRAGLNFIDASVSKFEISTQELKIPHVGFNTVHYTKGKKMFEGLEFDSDFYFIHSYLMKDVEESAVAAITKYGVEFVSAVEKGNIWGCQFHPEKSQMNGIHLLRNFLSV
ncbi:MAG: imidazole glycerol phosphate synthase subunit HisH [Bacteroidia bacterium]|nr:imidazole glycerol phosphate synthase subunit HisH [Bacteroidia bacterium]